MSSPSRLAWDMRRFGLTPSGLLARALPRDRPRVVCVSIPKAGTHLLERVVCQVPAMYRPLLPTVHAENLENLGGMERLLRRLRPGGVLVTHLHWSTRTAAAVVGAGAKCVFLIRDPRAVVVSQAAFIPTRPRHPQHAIFAALPDLRQRVLLAIRGNPATGFPGVAERFRAFGGWLDGAAHVVRFEDLVGARGGGCDQQQRRTVEGILAHLEVAVGGGSVDAIVASLFSSASPTFRRGAIDSWRDVFDDDVAYAFAKAAGPEFELYGYAQTRGVTSVART